MFPADGQTLVSLSFVVVFWQFCAPPVTEHHIVIPPWQDFLRFLKFRLFKQLSWCIFLILYSDFVFTTSSGLFYLNEKIVYLFIISNVPLFKYFIKCLKKYNTALKWILHYCEVRLRIFFIISPTEWTMETLPNRKNLHGFGDFPARWKRHYRSYHVE